MEEVNFKHHMPAQIRFSDVDQFGHVNNSVYFSLYDLAKTTYMTEVFSKPQLDMMAVVVANINANFLVPISFSDKIVIETATIHLGNKSFTLHQRAIDTESGIVKCECKTIMVVYDMATKEPMPIPEEYKKAICEYEKKSLEDLMNR